MNQKLLSGLTATLLVSAIGAPLAGQAKPADAVDPGSETTLKVASSQAPAPAVDLSNEVVKLGEQQSQSTPESTEAIAKVQSHSVAGRKAATLYVRNIPILTFLSSTKDAPETVKIGAQQPSASRLISLEKSLDASSKSGGLQLDSPPSALTESGTGEQSVSKNDPVWRASEIAARLNQVNRDGLDAQKIVLNWDKKTGYTIKAKDVLLAVVDKNTTLPGFNRNLDGDALQATNRLRRILGNAAPLSGAIGKPRPGTELSVGPFRIAFSGMASWYGPGFDGNQSASGEIFNQNKLTAAHRTLPFGTKVRVTNMDNGVSVVVRITDRGPFHSNRIIDLSTAAARVLGLVQSGVAPVRLDIVDPQSVAEN